VNWVPHPSVRALCEVRVGIWNFGPAQKIPAQANKVPQLRSGFRQRAQTPAERLNLNGAPSNADGG